MSRETEERDRIKQELRTRELIKKIKEKEIVKDRDTVKETAVTGCEVVNRLWRVALECCVDNPGIGGTISRINNSVKCANIGKFMKIATQKCQTEKNSK
jgi:hypothetical protein